ncbi:hypothetical protein C173_03534 [Paenibacillus sp. FSL R7-277]|uniref:hypothetical protein n=1 Tax=Paenibacillus sp. FSL R7-277 TaxID=1227352 RepID=UPI0003E2427F|nr:hypothetical protein [Paenibacillus sp. FSL R7-277]ETT77556.1 hypothetical protein C173_03534 [Paenibacillus sp. FSL R7-277]
MIRKRKYKYISIAIIVVLLAEAAIVTFPRLNRDSAVEESSQQQDEQTAAELSNLSGVAAKEILAMKKSGSSWNEITETLKQQLPANNAEDKQGRSNLLHEAGLGEELLKELRQKGFQDDEIMEAKMLAERTMQQLKEVVSSAASMVEKPEASAEPFGSAEEEIQSAYVTINEQFNEGEAVTLLLTLQQEFGSMEAVMNEYLLSLQIGLNLKDYITDPKTYQENKEQQTITLKESEMVTLDALEKRMLEQLQQGNEATDLKVAERAPDSNNIVTEDKESLIPDINPPTVQDVRPENPGEAVRQEIQAMNPNYK